MPGATTSINMYGLGHVLSERYIQVPVHQRSFAWRGEQVTELLDDLEAAIGRDDAEYFLGSIVLTRGAEPGRPQVVDGQQRLAVGCMIIGAVRDYFVGQEDERAEELARDFLVKTDLETLERQPRLCLNEADDEFFRKAVLSQPGSDDRAVEPQTDSHRRIAEAFQIVTEHVGKLIEGGPEDGTKTLVRWVKYLDEAVKVIVVEVPDEADAFLIFETLNDRGLALSVADLLKNYIFGRSEDRIDVARNNWTRACAALEGLGGEELLTTFIRHFWASKHGPIREKDLYADLKSRVSSRQNAIDFSAELAEAAQQYAAILNSDHETWKELGTEARQYVATLLKLRLEQYRPLLLACLSHFRLKDLKGILRLLVSWNARFLVVGGLGGGTMERYYATSATQVRSGEIKTARKLATSMAEVVPGDAAFQSAFAQARVSQHFLARYYLLALEGALRGEERPELVPNANEEQVNLEHILPQSPGDNWPGISDEDVKAHYKRVGNLTLMHVDENAAASNASFQDKRKFYADSQLKITEMVAQYDDWTPQAIADRQQRLAQAAPETWPITL